MVSDRVASTCESCTCSLVNSEAKSALSRTDCRMTCISHRRAIVYGMSPTTLGLNGGVIFFAINLTVPVKTRSRDW